MNYSRVAVNIVSLLLFTILVSGNPAQPQIKDSDWCIVCRYDGRVWEPTSGIDKCQEAVSNMPGCWRYGYKTDHKDPQSRTGKSETWCRIWCPTPITKHHCGKVDTNLNRDGSQPSDMNPNGPSNKNNALITGDTVKCYQWPLVPPGVA